MGWKGQSRRHSLARKGIKTVQPKVIAKGHINTEDEDYDNPTVRVTCPICSWGMVTDFDDAHDQLCDHMVRYGHLQKTRDYLVEKGILNWRYRLTRTKEDVWYELIDNKFVEI